MRSYLKKKKSLLVLAIVGLVLVVIGTTYAFFSYGKMGSKEHTIKSGAITFHYEESNRGITLENALPMTDAQGKAQSEYFDFRITSKSDFAEIPYVISAVTSSNSTLDSNVVKVYLTEVNNGVETQILLDKYSNLTSKVFVGSKTEKVMHRDIATVTGSEYEKNYRLRIWISDDIEWLVQENGVDTYPYQNKTLTLTVNVYTNEGNSLTENNITTPDDTRVKMMSMNAQHLLIDSEDNGVDYYVNVPNNTTTADLNIISNNAAATVNVTELGQTLSYKDDGIIKRLSTGTTYNLLTGDNFYKVRVTSADTTEYKDYIIKVNREKQHDNNLNTLNVEGYSFTEEFNEEETEYTVNLEGNSIVIGGQTVSDVASIAGAGEQQLEWGENRFTITVTAEDGTPKEYTIIVNNVRPTPPSIADEDGVNNTGNNVTEEKWTSSDKTISIVSPGTAISEVDHYEYYISSSNSTPSDDVTITGTTTDGTITVTNSGTNYVYYRTVSGAGYKSVWSVPQVVKIDKTEYTITYNLNSGSLAGGVTNPTKYKIDTETITLNNPGRTGYTFTGWTGSNGSTAQTSVTIPKGSTGNKTYTANWKANTYTVTLDKQSGSGGTGSVTATYGSAMPSGKTAPTRPCYTFAGYYDATSGGTQYYNASMQSVKNWDKTSATTLYARWTANTTQYVSSSGNDSTGLGTSGSPFATIGKAYSCPGNLTIKLLSNLTASAQTSFNANKTVTLTSNSGTYTITRASGLTSAPILAVSAGTATITNITFNGNNVSATKPVVNVLGGTLNLNSGVTVQNGKNTTASDGGGVSVRNATLTVNGASISNNKVNSSTAEGGGIYCNSSTVTINSGEIKNNSLTATGYGNGGGVFGTACSMNIKGGTVSNNTITSNLGGAGGGLYSSCVSNKSCSFTMTGGIVEKNSAKWGGGIIADNFGGNLSVSITGGSINNNTATDSGGGYRSYRESGTTNIVFGGSASIRNNTATENGGGVSLDGVLTFTMNAGTISGNTTKYGAGVIIFNNGTFYLKGGSVTSNNASINTGGIDVNYGKLYVQGGNVTNNTSTYLSGIFYCSNRSTYSYTSGTISGNSPTNVMSNTCN